MIALPAGRGPVWINEFNECKLLQHVFYNHMFLNVIIYRHLF